MEKENVPQDNANVFEGKLRVLMYATEKDGKYTKVPSVGWEPENVVLSQVWEDVNEKVEEVKKRVLAGELSPVAYYMEKQMMDVSIISQYTGFWKFNVKRHLKASNFAKLSEQQLEKYAVAFQITIEELKNIR